MRNDHVFWPFCSLFLSTHNITFLVHSLDFYTLGLVSTCIIGTFYSLIFLKSACTSFIISGLHNTSIAVNAIALAAISVFSCASLVPATAVNPWEWLAAVVSMEYIGWMDGLMYDTFPMSVDPIG